MREGILKMVFVGNAPESCSQWKERLEGLVVNNVKRIEVLTAMYMAEIHESLTKIGSMPHLFVVETRSEFEHHNALKTLKMMLPLSVFALIVDRRWDQRILSSHVLQARQGNDVDMFIANDADNEELVEMFDLVVRLNIYQKKALAPLKHFMEQKIE